MTPKLASTGQTSTNQCLHVVVWIFAHKISLNWNRFHHVNLAIIALLVNLIFRFYNGSVWQTGRVWATILVPMEFFQPTLSFETKNSIFLSDGDTLKCKTFSCLRIDRSFDGPELFECIVPFDPIPIGLGRFPGCSYRRPHCRWLTIIKRCLALWNWNGKYLLIQRQF